MDLLDYHYIERFWHMSLTSFSRTSSLFKHWSQLGSHSCSSSLLAGTLSWEDLVGLVQKSCNTTLSGLERLMVLKRTSWGLLVVKRLLVLKRTGWISRAGHGLWNSNNYLKYCPHVRVNWHSWLLTHGRMRICMPARAVPVLVTSHQNCSVFTFLIWYNVENVSIAIYLHVRSKVLPLCVPWLV